MSEFKPYISSDGSVGLYSSEFNDIFHSAQGALTEAYEKFTEQIDFDKLLQKENIKVLDLCYGIGYNSKSLINFLFDKIFFQKKFLKSDSCQSHIGAIYTDNIFTRFFKCFACPQQKYNETIYTDNIFSKLYIKAVELDENLLFLSPFIKTGIKKIDNTNITFDYNLIKKYIIKSEKSSKKKINNLINFLILHKIMEKYPQYSHNNTLEELLLSDKYKEYFDSDLKGVFRHFFNNGGIFIPKEHKLSKLHNIYYRYITNRYKNGLKRYKLQNIYFEPVISDVRDEIKNDKNLYDVIFLDAFTPNKCPCLWTYDLFLELYKHMSEDGMLITYSSSAVVRNAMISAGFFIGNSYNKRLDKFEGTIAVKNRCLIKYPLTEFDLGLLKTRAGIFYRDENLNAPNEAIIERRNTEVKNSNLLSSSQYIKQNKI